MIRVVFDTNILVSALLSDSGNEARLIAVCRTGQLTPCLSPEMPDGYLEVLSRGKFHFDQERLDTLIRFFSDYAIHAQPAPTPNPAPDPSNAKFIVCALTVRADFLVTGKRRHFPEPRYGTTQVVNARDLLASLPARPA